MAKKNQAPKREQGITIGGTARKMADGDTAEGALDKVEHVVGGKYDNERTRVTLIDDVGEVSVIYMPDRWASALKPWGGAYIWITRKGTGLATRWDVKIEKGAVAGRNVLTVETVEMEAPKGRGSKRRDAQKASKRAR